METKIVFADLPKTRVYLRPHEKGDLPFFCQALNNEGISKYLSRHTPVMLQEEEEWFESRAKKKDNSRACSIVLKENNQIIGSIGLYDIDWISRTATTGSFIGREDLLGKGLGTEAKMLWLKHAFLEINLRRIYSRVAGFNGRSLRYAQKCGYKEVARLPEHVFREGLYHDLVYLVVTQEQWIPLWNKFLETHS